MSESASEDCSPSIDRHRTAIGRTSLSRSVRAAVIDGLLREDRSFFDYGCGRGDDLRILGKMGFQGFGWDPVHRRDQEVLPAEIVNLGFVVNVIEDPQERMETLREAWRLAGRVLVVSARLAVEAKTLKGPASFEDGVVTSRRTFQKFFEHKELKQWIDAVLGVSAVPAGPGVYYVFRDELDRSEFEHSRYRRRIAIPRIARPNALFEEHKETLEPLIDFLAAFGRLPIDEELPNAASIRDVFGSTKRAFRVVEKATDTQDWELIAAQRTEDLLIYLALSRFERRPGYSALPVSLQQDVKAFFRTYKNACAAADQLLFSLGQSEMINQACLAAEVGKVTPEALYIHESALSELPSILRVFEGCARRFIGRVDGANIIKLNRLKPKVSYLSYPDFERDPHPALEVSVSVDLQTFNERYRDYRASENPPILHRKETLIAQSDPNFSKFVRLTAAEEKAGLLDDALGIGTLTKWDERLQGSGYMLRGHRLARRRPVT